MRIIFKLHIIYYLCLFLFIYLIPNASGDAGIIKFILLLLSLGLLITLCLFYVLIAFNKKYLAEKKNSYIIVGCMFIEMNTFLSLGNLIYAKTENMYLLYAIFGILFLTTSSLSLRIKASLIKNRFNPGEEAKMLLKVGNALEETPLINAISKIDHMFTAFCITLAIAEKFSVFAGVVGIILILSTKYLMQIKNEFLKSGLITVKETYFSIIFYYFCYIVSIIWAYFIPNYSAFMLGISGIFFLKLYIHRIALNVYDERMISQADSK